MSINGHIFDIENGDVENGKEKLKPYLTADTQSN
jgi:hypothetical protein